MKLGDVVGPGHKLLEAEGGCHTCPLFARKPNHHVPPTQKDTKLLLLGEAPGAREVEKGEGFVGDSGKRLRRYLHRHGITAYSLCNSVLCRPENNRTPKPKEVRSCMNQYVENVVRGYPVVALVGKSATRALFPDIKWHKLRGNGCRHPDFPGQVFFPMYHPAWVGYGGEEEERTFDGQVNRLSRILEGDKPDLVLHRPSDEGWVEGLKEALESRRITFDIETNNQLRSWSVDSRIISWALTANGRDVYFCREDDLPWTGANELLREFFGDPDRQVVGHHVGFDLEWFEREMGFKVRTKWVLSTDVLYYHLRGYQMPSLKWLVAEELDGYRYLVTSPGEDTDPEDLAWYNAEDVGYTHQLFEKGFKELTPGQRDLFLRVAGPSDLYLQRIHANGIWIDHDQLESSRESLEQERLEKIEEWEQADPDFEPGFAVHIKKGGSDVSVKDKELAEYLYDKKGLPVLKKTDSGNPSTDKDALRMLKIDTGLDWLDYPAEIRTLSRNLNTDIGSPGSSKGLIAHIDLDGRVHGDFFNTTTDSGRNSSRNPNMQNKPRDKRIRGIFGAPPGWMFVEADYSQIELRVVFSQSGDEAGLRQFREGKDIHRLTASRITGKDPEDITDSERTGAKAGIFSQLYSGDWRTVQRYALSTFDIYFTDERSKEISDGIYSTYRTLRPWHNSVVKELRKNKGTLEQVLGHRWYYEGWDHPKDSVREHIERAAINAQGQGPAAYMTDYLGILTQRLLIERDLDQFVNAVGTVHDSVLYEVKEGYLGELCHVLELANRRVYDWVKGWFRAPLTLDVDAGPRWKQWETNETITAWQKTAA